ncbi:hypothetical protein CY34DRAFT_17892 [Suillus luteus UH-Slu-Lm8-n1]|uniref:Uncharacterized protein n=1 Tax=Suillus luteus UH-Slu-Lm8-n1 TaxID=930992 RepID=A0A0C9Z9M7_9AGAM|nr:hypothetical protein CY34DRAFT_17892 [Suillus luteus UH-Slu-Lm8-n1]
MHRDRELNDRDTLHPRDAFYYRDTHNLRYTALELHRDALYGHGERERTYPSRYSPVLGPDYGREGGYARHDDLDEHWAFGGGAYRDSGYPQARACYHDSRWMDHVHNVDTASVDYVLQAFNRESTNPPRPPQ